MHSHLRAYYLLLDQSTVGILPVMLLYFLWISEIISNPFFSIICSFWMFFLICLLVCFVAQGLGLLCGSIFNVTNGAIFGTFFICPFLIFSGFFVKFSDVHSMLHWLFHISFLKYALEGYLNSLHAVV